MQKGFIHVYTGDGKGKTTCSVGLCVRARSRNYRVLFTQFMKTVKGGETELLKRLGVEVQRFERVLSPLFYPRADAVRLRRRALEALDEIKLHLDDFDLVVMDELIHLLKQGMVTEGEICEFIENRPEHVDIVLTGRGAPEWLIAMADHVTEMREVKHHSTQGHSARKGIEY